MDGKRHIYYYTFPHRILMSASMRWRPDKKVREGRLRDHHRQTDPRTHRGLHAEFSSVRSIYIHIWKRNTKSDTAPALSRDSRPIGWITPPLSCLSFTVLNHLVTIIRIRITENILVCQFLNIHSSPPPANQHNSKLKLKINNSVRSKIDQKNNNKTNFKKLRRQHHLT